MTLIDQARALLQQEFGVSAHHAVFAPGRVNLIGEHTDYNEGLALPCALGLGTAVAVSPRTDDQIVAVSVNGEELHRDQFSAREPTPGPRGWWGNYLRGMVAEMKAFGIQTSGAHLAIVGNVPPGAGLSSSASLSIAIGKALVAGHSDAAKVDATTLARWGQSTEHHYAGCFCGIMDQMTIAHASSGEAIFLDCRSLAVRRRPIPPAWSILIAHSGVPRELVAGEYNLRRQQCNDAARFYDVPSLRDLDPNMIATLPRPTNDTLFRRAKHVVLENVRVERAAEAMHDGDLNTFGRLLRESHVSLRDDFEVTVPEVDELVDLANAVIDQYANGVGGARMTGGGFGGCIVAAVPTETAERLKQALIGESRRAVWEQTGS